MFVDCSIVGKCGIVRVSPISQLLFPECERCDYQGFKPVDSFSQSDNSLLWIQSWYVSLFDLIVLRRIRHQCVCVRVINHLSISGFYFYSPADPETQPPRPRSNPPKKVPEHLAHLVQSAREAKRLHEENVDVMSKALSNLVQSHATLEEQLLRTKSKVSK
ncbi:hypothetical protein YC2023_088011 [Brassica napus]